MGMAGAGRGRTVLNGRTRAQREVKRNKAEYQGGEEREGQNEVSGQRKADQDAIPRRRGGGKEGTERGDERQGKQTKEARREEMAAEI